VTDKPYHLTLEPYLTQKKRWPQTGRHILAQFDEQSVIVYQAYNRSIGRYAAAHDYFGGGFGLGRMSWIKPNFLWMMYRSGWGTKEKQDVVLAIWLQRTAFDRILKLAVHSHYVPEVYDTEENWKMAIQTSLVRLQWDPDHNPAGDALERRAIQLGLRGSILEQYAREWILNIEDISGFVHEQHQFVVKQQYDQLLIPKEEIYPIQDSETSLNLCIS
jgi:hypothetical protein